MFFSKAWIFSPVISLNTFHDALLLVPYEQSIWAGQSKKGAYGFSDVIEVNIIDDVIYDVTLENVQHAVKKFQQNTVTIIF